MLTRTDSYYAIAKIEAKPEKSKVNKDFKSLAKFLATVTNEDSFAFIVWLLSLRAAQTKLGMLSFISSTRRSQYAPKLYKFQWPCGLVFFCYSI